MVSLRAKNKNKAVQPILVSNNQNLPGEVDNTITSFPYLRSLDTLILDINQATDDLEKVILPHQIIIQLL